MDVERALYRSATGYWANKLLLPLKLVVPQPLVARVPGLKTNQEIRVGVVLQQVRGRLLDVGCGANRLAHAYRRQGGQAVGVDVYPWDGVDQIVENRAELPFPDGSSDTITFVASFNHIPNRVDVLAEARRLLAPGGRVLLTNLRPVVSRLWHLWAFWDDDQHERGMKSGEVFGFRDEELAELLSRSGFRTTVRCALSLGLNHLWSCEPAR